MIEARVAILPSGVERLADAVAAGFTQVELEAMEERPAEHLEALADAGVFVACVRLSGALHVEDLGERRAALARLRRQVDDGARLGAGLAYLSRSAVSGLYARAFFADGCCLLADHAARRNVCLAVGPLPDGPGWQDVNHANVVVALEGDAAADAAREPWPRMYVRRPGKVMEMTLRAADCPCVVAVDLPR